jgi:hypothetical protein
MSINSIRQTIDLNQDCNLDQKDQLDVGYEIIKTERNLMHYKCANIFIQNLIREYKKHSQSAKKIDYLFQCYLVNVNDLELHDKKIFIEYIADPCDLGAYHNNEISFETLFKEYKKSMQLLLDEVASEVYYEDMEEMGLMYRLSDNNGEILWYRR